MDEARSVRVGRWKEGAVWALGDVGVLQGEVFAFFCSRRYPPGAVLPALEWAESVRVQGGVVACGFHSVLEVEVRDLLLLGTQPLVWVPARAPFARLPAWARAPFEEGRLLVASPVFAGRVCAAGAALRNRFVAAVATEVVAAYVAPGSGLEEVVKCDAIRLFA